MPICEMQLLESGRRCGLLLSCNPPSAAQSYMDDPVKGRLILFNCTNLHTDGTNQVYCHWSSLSKNEEENITFLISSGLLLPEEVKNPTS